MTMHLDIITPEKVMFNGEVEEVLADTMDGEIGILPHHMNLFTKLRPGELRIKIKNSFHSYGVTEGFLEVNENKVSILVDYAVPAEDIEVKQATILQQQSEKILSHKDEKVSNRDYAKARAELQKALMELHVAKKHKERNI